MTKNLPSIIEAARADKSQEVLVLIIRDKEAQDVMAAWTRYAPEYKDLPRKAGESMRDALARVWDTVTVDFARLSEMANVPMNSTIKIFARLKENRLVFPDGTIPRDATDVLKATTLLYVKSAQ